MPMKTRLRVKEVAKEKKMTMTRLHTKSEVAYSTIRKLFNEPYSTEVTLTTLIRLAQVLGVGTRDLLEDIDDEDGSNPTTQN